MGKMEGVREAWRCDEKFSKCNSNRASKVQE